MPVKAQEILKFPGHHTEFLLWTRKKNKVWARRESCGSSRSGSRTISRNGGISGKRPSAVPCLERSGERQGLLGMEAAIDKYGVPGIEGRVVALDVSAYALEAARNRVQSEGLDNVEFILTSVQDVASVGCSFDSIYGRFILMQLAKPFEALERLVSCLRPGGIIALDEPNQEADFAVPPCPPCAAANRVFLEYADRVGMNFRVGDSLFPMLRQLGLDILVARALQPILPIQLALQMFKHGLLDSVAPLTDSGIIDESTLDQLITDLDGWSSEPGDYYALSRQVQVSGRIP